MHALSTRILLGTAALLLGASAARADLLFDSGLQMFSATGQQYGRLFRTGTPSDWSAPKAFPGPSGTTLRNYEAFTVDSSIYPYLQIEFDDPGAVLFASAYLGSFQPSNSGANLGLDINYLGDAGSSGNYFGMPMFFQIVVPKHQDIVFVLSEVNPGSAAGKTFDLMVEGFLDSSYTNAVPEPAAVLLFGAAGLAVALRRVLPRSV